MPNGNEHKMEFKRHNNKWKVLESRSQSSSALKAKRGDTVNFSASDSDLYFHFMDEDLFKKDTYVLKKGHGASLKINDNIPPGTYKYAVFHLEARQFIEGNSPPAIIIE